MLRTLKVFSNPEFINEVNTKKYLGSQINTLNTLKNVNNITGNGFHWGIGFEKINLLKADKLISILPLEITKDPRFLEKLYVSATNK